MIIRDVDTSEEVVYKILERLDLTLGEEKLAVLDGSGDPFQGREADKVVFITSMNHGWLGYHQSFFRQRQRDIPLWIVLLLNDNPVVCNQAESGFKADGIRLGLFSINSEQDDMSAIAKEIRRLYNVKPKKGLLYSIRPQCGKQSLQRLLEEGLPDWSFETAEESFSEDYLVTTDASQIIIVGKTIQDFSLSVPKGMQPFYVLTMPDENVQVYLRQSLLPAKILKVIPSTLRWTEDGAAKHLFYISPLYEWWRRIGTDPSLDMRFVMWDEFGLPVSRNVYIPEKIQEFLAQFNQCEALIQALAR